MLTYKMHHDHEFVDIFVDRLVHHYFKVDFKILRDACLSYIVPIELPMVGEFAHRYEVLAYRAPDIKLSAGADYFIGVLRSSYKPLSVIKLRRANYSCIPDTCQEFLFQEDVLKLLNFIRSYQNGPCK